MRLAKDDALRIATRSRHYISLTNTSNSPSSTSSKLTSPLSISREGARKNSNVTMSPAVEHSTPA